MKNSREMFWWFRVFAKEYPFIPHSMNGGLFLTCFSRYFRKYKKIYGIVDDKFLGYAYHCFEEDFPYGSFEKVETYWN